MRTLANLKNLCLLLACLTLLLGGCGGGNLVFRDHSGKIVATGSLQIPAHLPPHGQDFAGHWRLLSADKSFPSRAVKSGSYRASVYQWGVSIDLNPGTADNNVLLGGPLTRTGLSGTWSLSTFTGAKDMGTFTVTR